MPPATTISDSPVCTACAASATAFSPEPQTLLIVIAATRGSQPPFSAACAQDSGKPACTTLRESLHQFAWRQFRAPRRFATTLPQAPAPRTRQGRLEFSNGRANCRQITGVSIRASGRMIPIIASCGIRCRARSRKRRLYCSSADGPYNPERTHQQTKYVVSWPDDE